MEKQVIRLVAQDRIEMPLSSMYQKLRKVKKQHASGLAEIIRNERDQEFEGNRVFAYFQREEKERARGMKGCCWCRRISKYGTILKEKLRKK